MYGKVQSGARARAVRHWPAQINYASIHCSVGADGRGVAGKMSVKFGLAFALGAAVWAIPACAQPVCVEPIPPAAPDPRKATAQQMHDALNDAKNFISQSDVYQLCLVNYIQAQKDEAAKEKTPFDVAMAASLQKKIEGNQAAKVRTGAEINDAMTAYKMAHPNN
jgi:hypothetical protein